MLQLLATDRGGLGDRAGHFVTCQRPDASAKRFPRLLEFRSTYEVEPTLTSPRRVQIEAPDAADCVC